MGGLLAGLDRALWQGPLSDCAAPQAELLAGMDAGYGPVLAALRHLHARALPMARAAQAAQARWPRSVDMAHLAWLGAEQSSAQDRRAAFERLARLVTQEGRRFATLAAAALEMGELARAEAAFAAIDPEGQSAAEDIRARAEFSIARGDFAAARADAALLRARERESAAQQVELACAYHAQGPFGIAEASAPEAIDFAFAEGDIARAAHLLAGGQGSEAQRTRLALAQGDAIAVRMLLLSRCDPAKPWTWRAVDHLQWLRLLSLEEALLAERHAHAMAALRLFPRHAGLVHIVQSVQMELADWDTLTPLPHALPSLEAALIDARQKLRMGLPARALRALGRHHSDLGASLLRAAAFTLAGRVSAARVVLHRAEAHTAPARADLTLARAEAALDAGAVGDARALLAAVAPDFPDRLPLILAQMRCAFHAGDYAQAAHALARFNMIKQARDPLYQASDLRDRMLADALTADAAKITDHPSLSAAVLKRQGPFTPDPEAAIPRTITHYWEGPEGPAIPRARAQWVRLHPGFAVTLFTRETARDWIAQTFDAAMRARFDRLTQPALRADLFRALWITREGGIFADLDEWPRLPVTPWLQEARAVFCIERGMGTVANNFLAAMPQHPVCAAALARICAALDTTNAPYAWWHSGPAQWTCALAEGMLAPAPPPGLRLLSQSAYSRRISTNLPYPHKRRPDHWR